MGFRRSAALSNKPEIRKVGNWGFLFAVPSVFILATLALIILLVLFKQHPFDRHLWVSFCAAFFVALILVTRSSIQRLRTLVHELKHALLVVVTGNSVDSIEVGSGTGRVRYRMRSDKAHFGPIITLAPYFFPLLSLPVFLCALYFEGPYRLSFVIGLGVTLAFDYATNVYELHPNQTDLKAIYGGFLVAGSFLAGANLLWGLVCLIWVTAGRAGYITGWYIVRDMGMQIIAHLH